MTIRRQPADVVQFTRGSAERISRVVRTVENAVPPGSALTFDRVQEFSQRRVFRICTFTGPWSIDTSKTVTFRNVTTTPNTVVAHNLFATLAAPGSPSPCAIARDGTAWYLIAARC